MEDFGHSSFLVFKEKETLFEKRLSRAKFWSSYLCYHIILGSVDLLRDHKVYIIIPGCFSLKSSGGLALKFNSSSLQVDAVASVEPMLMLKVWLPKLDNLWGFI